MDDLNQVKVLVVDDSITVRELMKQQLLDLGIREILVAKNGAEALEKIKTDQPKIVFLDINMPEMNGIEVLTKILSIDPKSNVIMLSSLGTKEKIKESLENGAKNFLMKPVENENLKRIISELIQE